MDNTTFLAMMFGPFFLVGGLGFLLNGKNLEKMTKDFMENPGLIFLGAIMSFIAGMAMILVHNIWTGWAMIITILGWAMLLKGTLLFLFPKQFEEFTKKLCCHCIAYVGGGIWLVIGAFLTYMAYFA